MPAKARRLYEAHRTAGMTPLRRAALLFMLGCVSPYIALAQSDAPRPNTAVAIENTNSTLTPSTEQLPQASPARPTVTMPAPHSANRLPAV